VAAAAAAFAHGTQTYQHKHDGDVLIASPTLDEVFIVTLLVLIPSQDVSLAWLCGGNRICLLHHCFMPASIPFVRTGDVVSSVILAARADSSLACLSAPHGIHVGDELPQPYT
jgi:hypothetical protein